MVSCDIRLSRDREGFAASLVPTEKPESYTYFGKIFWKKEKALSEIEAKRAFTNNTAFVIFNNISYMTLA